MPRVHFTYRIASFSSSKHQYREKETELTHDEEVMAASLHSYFGDLLKQTGPVRVDDTKFAEAMAALDPECRKLVARYQIQQQSKYVDIYSWCWKQLSLYSILYYLIEPLYKCKHGISAQQTNIASNLSYHAQNSVQILFIAHCHPW